MDHVRPTPALHFLQSDAQIFEPALIEKIQRAVRLASVDQRGRSINDQALLVFGPSVTILGWTRLHGETQSDISLYLCLSVKAESTDERRQFNKTPRLLTARHSLYLLH